MKKYMLDMKVTENCSLHKNYCLLKLTSDQILPEMLPGQFVQVRVDNSPTTFLRRPISINYVDRATNELWLLVQLVGDGTRRMAEYKPGDVVNIMLPLGNGFTLPADKEQKLLLIGGGVGTAPMLYLGAILKKAGYTPTFLLGARSKEDVLQLEQFEQLGTVYVTTEDGSLGEKGLVTQHFRFVAHSDMIYCCGPMPMMRAVAASAYTRGIECEVSLENKMACGLGTCLCCVEDTVSGNECTCTKGPVFNIKQLKWQI